MGILDFSGRTVLVVGGSSGIGNGIAQAFRSQGASVHVWGTRGSPDDYAGEEGCQLNGLHYEQVDVTDFSKVASCRPGFDRLDVLVLAQGTVRYKRAEFQMDSFQQVLDVNLSSVMACCSRFESILADSKGSVITVSSTTAYQSAPGNPAYSASKAALLGLTRSLADAWATKGIRVNGIAPGLVDTKLTKVTTANPERLSAFLRDIPVGRVGTPSEMAGVALFLASPLASYVIGQTIVVDGGLVLR